MLHRNEITRLFTGLFLVRGVDKFGKIDRLNLYFSRLYVSDAMITGHLTTSSSPLRFQDVERKAKHTLEISF